MQRLAIISFIVLVVILGCSQASSYKLPSWQNGQWVEYAVSSQGGASVTIRYSLVGDHTVEGVKYFWFETYGKMDTLSFIFKMMVPERISGQARRVIIKIGDQPAVEMPVELSEVPDEYRPKLFDEAEIIKKQVKTEKVKTLAGEFRCIHSKIGDTLVWVSPQVPILGLVKYKTPDEELELRGFGLTGAKTQITELPERLDLNKLFPHEDSLRK